MTNFVQSAAFCAINSQRPPKPPDHPPPATSTQKPPCHRLPTMFLFRSCSRQPPAPPPICSPRCSCVCCKRSCPNAQIYPPTPRHRSSAPSKTSVGASSTSPAPAKPQPTRRNPQPPPPPAAPKRAAHAARLSAAFLTSPAHLPAPKHVYEPDHEPRPPPSVSARLLHSANATEHPGRNLLRPQQHLLETGRNCRTAVISSRNESPLSSRSRKRRAIGRQG